MESEKPPKRGRWDTDVPTEITENILLQVRATDLLPLSCVSKSWNSIISDPVFVKRHMKMRIMIPAYVNYRPYIEKIVPAQARPDGSPPNPWSDRAVIHGACDGLFCVQLIQDGSLFLCNPTTGKYRKLPDCSYSNPKMDHNKFVYGLGVVPGGGGDYKVLAIPRQIPGGGDERWKELYSSRSNSWKKLEGVGECVGRWGNERFAFLGEALYWVDHRKVIAFLNLSTEEYGEVAAPEYPDPLGARDTVEVGVMDKRLCVCVSYYEGKRFLMWLGRNRKWVSLFKVDCPWLHPTRCYAMTPLHLDRNKEILVHLYAPRQRQQSDSRVYRYYKAKDEIGKTNIRNAYFYRKTLVSPALN